MSKRKPRKLWTKIRGTVPPGTTAAEFWGTLRKVVRSGEYELPDGWDVTIEWKNREDRPYKSADFETAMTESAESSRGWDKAILHHIRKEINRLPEPDAVASRTGKLTRRLQKEKRSAAARKAARTKRRFIKVTGYTRSDGTRVKGYRRRRAKR